MYLMHGVRQRVILAIVAIIVLAAAAFALGARSGWWPKPIAGSSDAVLPGAQALSDATNDAGVIAIAAGGVLILLALGWMASLLPRRVADASLRWVDEGSVTKLDARELGRQLAESLERRPGVTQADVAVHGSSHHPMLIVQVTADATTDFETVRDAVVETVIRPAEAMLERRFESVDVEYHATAQRAASARSDLNLNPTG